MKYEIKLIKKPTIIVEGLTELGEYNEYSTNDYPESDLWANFYLEIRKKNKKEIPLGQCIIRSSRGTNMSSGTLDIFILKKYRRKGLAKLLMEDALRRCEKELHFNFVKAIINPENESSINLFTSIGFQREGRMPDRIKDGKIIFYDHYYKYFTK